MKNHGDAGDQGLMRSHTGRERFGLATLTCLVIANMVGAGVFTTSGFTLESLGSPRLVVLAWVFGGLIALAGAISYGRLVRAMPESGGEYLFLSRAAHPLLGFIAGWVSLLAGFTGAIAFAATAMESYLVPEGTRPDWLPESSIAIGVVLLGGVWHGLRPRGGAALQNAAVLLKLGLLVGLLILALSTWSPGAWHGEPLARPDTNNWPLVAAFATAVVWISLSYSGFNAAVYIAEEARDGRRSVPRALWLGTIIVTCLYVPLNAVFVYAPPPEVVAGVPDVAGVVAHHLGGSGAALFVRCTIALALFTSVSSMVMAAPRVYAKMADDGLFPDFLRYRGDAPGRAVVMQVALAVVLILASSLRGLLTYLGLTLSLCAALSVCCLFLPSVRERRFLDPFHLPPMFFIACTLVSAIIMVAGNPWQIAGTLLTFAAGGLAYLLVRKKKPDGAAP